MALYKGFLGKMRPLGKLLPFLSYTARVYLQAQSFFTPMLYSTVDFSLGGHFIHFTDSLVSIMFYQLVCFCIMKIPSAHRYQMSDPL